MCFRTWWGLSTTNGPSYNLCVCARGCFMIRLIKIRLIKLQTFCSKVCCLHQPSKQVSARLRFRTWIHFLPVKLKKRRASLSGLQFDMHKLHTQLATLVTISCSTLPLGHFIHGHKPYREERALNNRCWVRVNCVPHCFTGSCRHSRHLRIQGAFSYVYPFLQLTWFQGW